MKKFIVAIITLLYAASSSGATVHFHYCMGKLVNAGLTHDKKQKCSKCGMDKKESRNSCCKDVHKFVKVENDHQKGSFDQPVFLFNAPCIDHSASYQSFLSDIIVSNHPANGPPLLTSGTPLFIRYCNFRI